MILTRSISDEVEIIDVKVIQATADDFETIKQITQTTIRAIYPRYYPAGAVDYFCRHHSDESIKADIASGKVYLLCDDEMYVGTVTVSRNGINRLFGLPEYQHRGYGRTLLDFAERKILTQYDTIRIDASFPAKQIYRKRGYRETEYHMIQTGNDDYLCYDVMELRK